MPRHLHDAHYAGAKRLGHGEGYEYAHDAEGGIAAQDYLGVERNYRPTDRGFEKELAERLELIRAGFAAVMKHREDCNQCWHARWGEN